MIFNIYVLVGLSSSSIVNVLSAQHSSIRDCPVSLNKSCKYKLVKKHETETGTTLCLHDLSGDISDVVDVSFTEWHGKLQDSECRAYTGGEYCTVLL